MKTNKQRSISTILLFIVITMLIGILSACEGIGDDTAISPEDTAQKAPNPFYWEYTPELEPLTQEQVDACNQAARLHYYGTLEDYLALFPEEKKDMAKEGYEEIKHISTSHVRPYLGTFNGAIVAANILPTMEATEIVIGNHMIYFSTGAGIAVYKDGEITGILNAYEYGWLTDDDIGIISERVEKYYNARFGKNE